MAINKQEAADSLFGMVKKTTVEKEKPTSKMIPIEQHPKEASQSNLVAAAESKWKNHEKVTVVFTFDQKEGLDRLAKQIQRNRPKHTFEQVNNRERITANTLLRALVDLFLEEGPFSEPPEINNEVEVKEWLRKVFIR